MERWKDIEGYGGVYQVSDEGRVRVLFFTNNQVKKLPKVRVMRPFNNGNGYYVVSLTQNGKRKNHYVHRLVAAAFLGNPDSLPVVNHINHDKSDNRAQNLEWCTQKTNVDKSRHLMCHPKAGAKVSSTGEKYIRLKKGKFELVIEKLSICKTFQTLDEAVKYRNEVML